MCALRQRAVIHLAVDGTHYEIDLSAQNIAEFKSAIGGFIESARKVKSSRSNNGRRARSAGAGRGRQFRGQTRAVRQWARQHGHNIGSRGRIPASTQQAFDRGAHSCLVDNGADCCLLDRVVACRIAAHTGPPRPLQLGMEAVGGDMSEVLGQRALASVDFAPLSDGFIPITTLRKAVAFAGRQRPVLLTCHRVNMTGCFRAGSASTGHRPGSVV